MNVEKFEKYAQETAAIFDNLYGWYYVPAHVHKLLKHGADVIRNSLLPLGK